MLNLRNIFLILVLAMSLQADMFNKGNASVGIKLGGASIGDEDYNIIGLGGSYFVMDDLSVGLGYERWFSGTPTIQKLTVESTYFLPIDKTFRPYAGLIYRRILISDGYNDTNAYGYRAGIAMVQDRLLISAGIVQEKYESRQGFLDSTETYAEVVIGFTL